MADASDPKAVQDQRHTEKAALLEALQAERRKALEKLRVALEREVMLQKLWVELGGDAHYLE
jgi:hypothetical protein